MKCGIPNNAEGFGRVDMAATLSASVQLQDEATALDAGDEETTTFSVGEGAALKVTLAWTDRPGSTLQNDLDLIGPNSDADLITQDDDSGPGLLSRIQTSLAAGTYFVRVRHFSPAQTGAYGVRVRRV